MRPTRLLRTSSFRLTLLYAALFGASVLILFGVMLWSATSYVVNQIDTTVANEIAEVQADASGQGLAGLRAVVTALAAQEGPGAYYLLEDAAGQKIAGNLPAMAPIVGIRHWTAEDNGSRVSRSSRSVRGRGVRTAGGGYLFVGLDNFQLNEMRETITRSFLWVLVATIALALAGGVVMSLGLLRRVEAVSRASRDIVAGDLSRRIEVRGSNDEFDHLAVSLNAMLDRIEALMEGVRQVSSDIAHDLRTPLTRLRQRMELARRRGGTLAALEEALDGSIREVDGILDTFGALLRIAQIEAGAGASEFDRVDLTSLLEGMTEAYQVVAEEQGQGLSAAIAPGLCVTGDRDLLTQAISNLIENAIRHCPSGATIRLAASMNSGQVEVNISDNGPGIPQELREKVFQRFVRLDRSRTTPGTGLGLSLVAAIAGLHDIRIELAENHPGLLVRLRFPDRELGNAELKTRNMVGNYDRPILDAMTSQGAKR